MGDRTSLLDAGRKDPAEQKAAAASMFRRANALIDNIGDMRDVDTHKTLPDLHEARNMLYMAADEIDPLAYRNALSRCHYQFSRCYERQSEYDNAWREGQDGLRLLEETLPMARTSEDRRAMDNGIADLCS